MKRAYLIVAGIACAMLSTPDMTSGQSVLPLLRLIPITEALTPTHVYQTGYLFQSGIRDVSYQLHAGVEYSIIGVCDDDCDDLDLQLYSSSDVLLGTDSTPGDVPEIRFTPTYTAVFRIRVKMYRCSLDPCEWGVGVYR